MANNQEPREESGLPAQRHKGTPAPGKNLGAVSFKALRPLMLVLVLWLTLALLTYWANPQVTAADSVAISYNDNRWIALLIGLALALGAVNLTLQTSTAARNLTGRLLGPLARWWQRVPAYTRKQWTSLIRAGVVVVVAFTIVGLLRGGGTWPLINEGLASLPIKLPEYLVWGVFYAFIMVGSFLLLFVVLSRGGVTTLLPEDITTSFDQVWGQDRVVERVKETVLFLSEPDRIEEAGGHVPSGVLLWGPPGTGKTLIAEAVAGETGTPFVLVEPGAFQNMFVGIGVLRVKTLYRKLRKLSEVYGGVVVFFDEADVLGSRGASTGSTPPASMGSAQSLWDLSCSSLQHASAQTRAHFVQESWQDKAMMPVMGGGDLGVLNAVLAAMQGVRSPRGWRHRLRRSLGLGARKQQPVRILHFMATNLPSALDPALLRPGRIDRIMRVGYPSKEGRERTFTGYLDRVEHTVTPAQIAKLAEMTPQATGAVIKDLVNEALIEAIRNGRGTVTYQDMLQAKRFKEFGPPEGVEYVPFERHAVAIHEACHALVAWRRRKHLTIDTVTIEKGRDFLGMVASVPADDTFTRWESECSVDIAVSLAALAGERLFFADSTSGVSSDLDTATRVAMAMVTRWGMRKTLASSMVLLESGMTPKNDAETNVEELLQEVYEQAKLEVENDQDRILALAHALEMHRTLTGADVEAVLNYQRGVDVNGEDYDSPEIRQRLRRYHELMLESRRGTLEVPPDPREVLPVTSGPENSHSPQ